jgi:hypothetical protein
VGAGTFRERTDARSLRKGLSLSLALRALEQQIGESQQLILLLMSLLGERMTSWMINSEIGDLGTVLPPRGPLFRFLRYDIRLDPDWLKEFLGATPDALTIDQLRRLDDTRSMPLLEQLAISAANKQVLPAHWAAPPKLSC